MIWRAKWPSSFMVPYATLSWAISKGVWPGSSHCGTNWSQIFCFGNWNLQTIHHFFIYFPSLVIGNFPSFFWMGPSIHHIFEGVILCHPKNPCGGLASATAVCSCTSHPKVAVGAVFWGTFRWMAIVWPFSKNVLGVGMGGPKLMSTEVDGHSLFVLDVHPSKLVQWILPPWWTTGELQYTFCGLRLLQASSWRTRCMRLHEWMWPKECVVCLGTAMQVGHSSWPELYVNTCLGTEQGEGEQHPKPAKVDAAMAWTCVWCAWEMPWDGGVINKIRSREPGLFGCWFKRISTNPPCFGHSQVWGKHLVWAGWDLGLLHSIQEHRRASLSKDPTDHFSVEYGLTNESLNHFAQRNIFCSLFYWQWRIVASVALAGSMLSLIHSKKLYACRISHSWIPFSLLLDESCHLIAWNIVERL